MVLSEDLVNDFVKSINNDNSKNNNEAIYGTVVETNGSLYVRLDGADENVLTPAVTAVTIKAGDRVSVIIRNHTALITGNVSDPAIGVHRAGELESAITQTAAEIRLEVKNTADNLDSKITQTASEIRSEVSDATNGLESKITQNSNSISTLVTNQNEFTEFKQTVEGFEFMGAGGTVKIDGGNINLTGAITWSDLASDVQTEINSAGGDGEDSRLDDLIIQTSGGTYIDGEMIYSDSIYTDALHLGGEMTVYETKYGSTVGGYLGWSSGFASTTGIGIMDSTQCSQLVCTNEAARLSYETTAQFIASNNGYAYVVGDAIVFAPENNYQVVIVDGCMRPHANAPDNIVLGHSSYPWANVYAKNHTTSTSDRNKKNSIENLPDKYLTIFDNLTPRRFKLNDGTSGRYHVGYIAQEVKEAMDMAGVTNEEFGGFVKDVDADGTDVCMLRYGEFDAIYAAKIKQLEARIIELEARLDKLEGVS